MPTVSHWLSPSHAVVPATFVYPQCPGASEIHSRLQVDANGLSLAQPFACGGTSDFRTF